MTGRDAPRAGEPDAAQAPARRTLAVLLRLLQAEGAATTAGDIDALGQVVRDKEAALRSLITELAGHDCAPFTDALRRVRDLNQRNARLLAPHAKANRARIETLFSGARSSALYSPDGHAARPHTGTAPRGVRA